MPISRQQTIIVEVQKTVFGVYRRSTRKRQKLEALLTQLVDAQLKPPSQCIVIDTSQTTSKHRFSLWFTIVMRRSTVLADVQCGNGTHGDNFIGDTHDLIAAVNTRFSSPKIIRLPVVQ